MIYFRPQTWALLAALIGLLFIQGANASGTYYCAINHQVCGETYAAACSAVQGTNPAYTSTYVNPNAGNVCMIEYDTCYPGGCNWGSSSDNMSVNTCEVEGEEYNPATYECGPPPPPTDAECVAENGPGYVYMPLTIGDEDMGGCALPFPENQEEDCSNPIGTIEYNGETTVVCGDQRDTCTNTGGTWGTWGAAGEEKTGCLADDYDDNLPTCSSTGAFVADAASSSFVCESPEPLPEQPNIDNPDPVDTDGDGTPDKDDDDIDGDGIPNSTDPDRDGDGVANEDDLTPDGESTEDQESSVDGGADCLVAPRCSGDAIQCSILYQAWKTRCENQDSGTEEIPDGTQASLESSLDVSGDNLLDGVGTAFTDSVGDGQSGIVAAPGIGDDLPGVFNPGACSDVTFSGPSGQSMTISCTKTAKLREILGIVAAILTLFVVFNIAMKGEVK